MPFLDSITADLKGDGFPFSLPAVRALRDGIRLHPKVTFFVGENGTGKSTVLEAIADKWGFSRESGNRSASIGMRAYDTVLGPCMTVSKTTHRPMDGFYLRAESFCNFATYLDDLENEPFCANGYFNYGGRSLHEQSHGESFLSLFINRFDGHGLFLLDEPEAALSPSRQLAFLVRMNDLVAESSQFIIATHSPIILAYPEATIYQFDENGIDEIAYKDTPNYQLTRRFLDHPESMMEELFKEEESEPRMDTKSSE